jgi:hypothetical protein
MNRQRGVALSGLIFWGIVIALVAIMGMKVVPTTIEYYKVLAAIKKTVNQVGPEATVPDVRKTFERYIGIDHVEFDAKQLEITKNAGKIVVSFNYDKVIPLFANVSLLINYKGSSAE